MSPGTLLASANRLPLWRRRVRVWDFEMMAPTFDRWLYLWMHRLGRMGRPERKRLAALVRPGQHVADVGANIGLYSLLLARLAGPAGSLCCFEPDALMAGALHHNLVANGQSRAEVFACAIGASPGNALLQRNALNSGDNRLGDTTGTALHSHQATVPVRTLHEALAGRPLDFIKMDVQGWEGEALRGLGDLLERNPNLRIYFEFWPYGLRRAGTPIAQLNNQLRQLGLRVSLADNPLGGPVDLEQLANRLAPQGFTDLLAAH